MSVSQLNEFASQADRQVSGIPFDRRMGCLGEFDIVGDFDWYVYMIVMRVEVVSRSMQYMMTPSRIIRWLKDRYQLAY